MINVYKYQNSLYIYYMKQRLTTSQLSDKARNGYTVIINGHQKSSSQLANMKGKSYLVELDGKILKTVNVQTL